MNNRRKKISANLNPTLSNILKWRSFYFPSSFYGHYCAPNKLIQDKSSNWNDFFETDSWGIIKNKIGGPETKNRIKGIKDNIPKIAFFGGSTIQGVGSGLPDFSIPSLVEKNFKTKYDRNVICVNHGVAGWYCAEQFHFLLHQMKYKPDYVVFYDGWNCVWNLYNGMIMAEENKMTWKKGTSLRHVEYDLINSKMFDSNYLIKRGLRVFFNKICDNTARIIDLSYWSQVWNFLAINFFPIKPINYLNKFQNYNITEKKFNRIMGNVVDEYLRIHFLAKAFCESQNIKFIHFLQPTLHSVKRDLSHKEKVILDKNIRISNPNMYSQFPSFIKKAGWPQGLLDLSDCLNDLKDDIFVDDGHLNQSGNIYISNEIVDHLSSEL